MPPQANRKPPPLSRFYSHSREDGFILIATLAMLGFALASVLIATTLLQMQADRVKVHTHQILARQHALAALDIAIAQLQESTGHDRVITLPAATLLDANPSTLFPDGVANPHWVQAVDLETRRKDWLVSSIEPEPDPTKEVRADSSVFLVGKGTTGATDPGQWVQVQKVPLNTTSGKPFSNPQLTGYYAYWTGELNTRANITSWDRISSFLKEGHTFTYNQLSMPRRTAIESLFPAISDPDTPETQEQISRLQTPAQLFYLLQDREALRKHFFDFTTSSRSVLSNTIDGGLKINLSDPTYTDTLITPGVRQQITPAFYTNGDAKDYQVQGDDPSQVFAATDAPATDQLIALHQPIITDFCLSMGIFHTQYDRRHRIRYHMHVEWLNPYPYPMGFLRSRAYLIIADHLPTLEVTNESSGQRFTVNLNHFDPDLTYNSENTSKIFSWFEFDKLSVPRSGALKYGIDGGRIYRMSEPNKIAQPRGLARTIQEEPNRWYWGGDSPPMTGPRPTNTLYASDTIRIRSVTPVRMNLTVVPIFDGGSVPRETHPDNYAAEKGYVMQLKNIPFGDIDISVSGSTYSRSTSGSFAPPDYRLAFHFKLDESNPRLFEALGNQHSFRNPIIDLNDPQHRSLFEVLDVAAAARSADPLTSQEIFWDDTERENTAKLAEDEYQFHLYDVPVREPLSPGVFSQLHFQGRPHPWIGSVDATINGLNQSYDRYYFSGTQISPEWKVQPPKWEASSVHAGLLANHFVRPVLKPDGTFPDIGEMTSSKGAAYSLMEGGFNIFSASPVAWKGFLKNQFRNYATFNIQNGTGHADTTSNVFSRLPFASSCIEHQLADSAIPHSEPRNKPLYRQGVRAIDGEVGEERMELLAQNIVTHIRSDLSAALASGSAITSLRDLMEAGSIDRAITISGINAGANGSEEDIDPLSPAYLRQSDIFSLLGSRMTTRSDTFVIRCFGESTDAPQGHGHSKARAFCEAVVQRFPDYMIPADDAALPATRELNLLLGRRYRVVSFRWLQAHEI